MTRLPLYLSVPHAGTQIPPEVRDLCILQPEDILADYDAGADSIYGSLQDQVTGFCSAAIARSLVDLNRAPGDIGGDGVIKSHTSWDVQVFREFPAESLIRQLLARYYFPYHEEITAGAGNKAIKLGLDCHTMAAVGPPIGPDPGRGRPMVCISNAHNTCPEEWLNILAACLTAAFKKKVAINSPFQGGYIIRSHAAEMPWIQIEISQSSAYSNELKRNCMLEGLQSFCHTVFG